MARVVVLMPVVQGFQGGISVMTQGAMDRLYRHYSLYFDALNGHAPLIAGRLGSRLESWRLRKLSRESFAEILRSTPRTPTIKVAWLERILNGADEEDRKAILREIPSSLDPASAAALIEKSRQAA